MLKIIAACGAGMGTSLIIRIKVEKILKELGKPAAIEAMSMGQAKSFVNSADIIICSKHLASEFDHHKRAKIVSVKNLMSDAEIKAALEEVL